MSYHAKRYFGDDMAVKKPKKTAQIILRLDPELDAQFREVIDLSGLTITEALRSAASAMVGAHKRLGRIPKDMEIRQAQVDLSSPAEAAKDAWLLDLATRYAGYLTPRLAHALQALQVDQPAAAHALLTALLEHLSRGLPLDDIAICPRAEWKPAPYLAQVAEPPAAYTATKKPPDPAPRRSRAAGTGPVADVSDRPA
jgi:antitoxin component of RelBE/YafQ-DinJ toxin-antitoxin module